MGSTASLFVNRITVCITTKQREFLFSGMREHGIGLSEFTRRVLDEVLARRPAAQEVKGRPQ
jgi:hypothetical protein